MFLGKSCAVGLVEADFSVTRFLCDSVSPWLTLSVRNFRKLTTETQRHRGSEDGSADFSVTRFLCDSVSPWLTLSIRNCRMLTTETQRHRGESFGELFGVARS